MASSNTTNQYADIIHLPHHRSTIRPCMSIHDRAAQFAPFAALTGHDDAIRETARLTDTAIEPDESQRSAINNKLLILQKHLAQNPEITVIFFQPDERKDGGAYHQLRGCIKKLDPVSEKLIFSDGREIAFSQIADLDSPLFSSYQFSF